MMARTLKQLTREELFALFDAEVHGALEHRLAQEHVAGLLVFENLQLDSRELGQRTAVIYGPSCTFKSPAMVEGQHLHDLPSQRQYPVAFYAKEGSR